MGFGVWLGESAAHVVFWLRHARCEMCKQVKVPHVGGFLARRRVCIYCRECAPEFYE